MPISYYVYGVLRKQRVDPMLAPSPLCRLADSTLSHPHQLRVPRLFHHHLQTAVRILPLLFSVTLQNKANNLAGIRFFPLQHAIILAQTDPPPPAYHSPSF
jgi:hypothetical protein